MNQNVATRFLCATAVCVLSFTTVAQPIHIAGWNVAPSNGSAVFLVTNTVPTTRYALQTSSSLNGWNDSQYRLAHGNYLAMTASFSSASPKMFFRVAQSPFLTEGIEGQWRVFMLTAADDPGDYAGWFTSIMSFTSAGAGTWSSVQRSNGDTSSPPGVTFAVAPDGSISGGPPGSTWLMSLDKNTITFVMDDGGGGVNLGVMTRK